MRIIAGSCKGRRLVSPRWSGLRPTSDRLRETLFNILRDDVSGARVLDGYAGTGAVGIEALSRGADHVVFIEQDRRAVDLIQRNVSHCDLTGRCTIRQAHLPGALVGTPPRAFDLVWLDPPYDASNIGAILTTAAALVRATGWVVLEHAWKTKPPGPATLQPMRVVRAGRSVVQFYQPTPIAETISARAEIAGG